jgi:hypothetical protein
MGTKGGALSPGVKWPGLKADYSTPTRAKVKITWIYIYIQSPYTFND